MTKDRALDYYIMLNMYHKKSIYDAYENPSIRKVNAYEFLEAKYSDRDIKSVLTYNNHNFTYGVLLDGSHFMIYTSVNRYHIEFEHIDGQPFPKIVKITKHNRWW